MEEKTMSPQESMELIATMIQRTKRNVALSDTRISIMWAVVSIVTAIVVISCVLLTNDSIYNLIWYAIPLIGIPSNLLMARKKHDRREVKSYVDKVTDGVWRVVGWIGILISVMCVVFSLAGYSGSWKAMFLYPFIIVGFGASVQGIVLSEKSYVVGGVFSILSGFGIVMALICDMPIGLWAYGLFALCFVFMFIVPAIIIRHKIKRGEV